MKGIYFEDLLDREEDARPKMGRVNMAEEALIKKLFGGHGNAFQRFASARRNPIVPAVKTSRPVSSQGGQTFVFSVKGWHSPGRVQRFCVGPKQTASAHNLSYHAKTRHFGGIGAYRFTGATPPAGMTEVSAFPHAQLRIGGAGVFQEYIEREGAIEMIDGEETSIGNIHPEHAFRVMFWDAVQEREGSGKRIQTRLIAELPYEAEVGAEGRRRILEKTGALFGRYGLPWHGVVHVPEQQSDPRNYHLHLLFHDRPLLGWDNYDQPIFDDKKNRDVRETRFIKHLREEYAEIVNEVFEESGLTRRWDHRSYREMGIDKPPQPHLGSAVMGLERRGIVTANGKRVAEAEEAWRYQSLVQDRTIKLVGLANRFEERLEEIKAPANGPLSSSVRASQAGYLEAVTKASRQYMRVLNWQHQRKWFAERHRMLRSRMALQMEDPEFGEAAGKFLKKLDRFYGRMVRNADQMADGAQRQLEKGRATLRSAQEGLVVESLLDQLRRADGALEVAIEHEALKRRQEKAADENYDKLLREQNGFLQARARLKKRLPPDITWQTVKDKVMAGEKAWTLEEVGYVEAQQVVLGLSRTTRKLERLLRLEQKADRQEEGPRDVLTVQEARKEKLAVLKEIRRSELMRVIWPKAREILRKRDRHGPGHGI